MKKKLRLGISRKGELFPWLGVITPTVPDEVGEALIVAVEQARSVIRLTQYADWADKLICEWRNA